MSDINTMGLQDFFKETFSEEFEKEAEVDYVLAEIAGRAYQTKELSGLSYREIASRMGLKSPAVVQRIVDEADPHNVTLSTLVRFSQACGFRLEVEFRPFKTTQQWVTVLQHAIAATPPPPNLLEGIYAAAAVKQQPRLEHARVSSFVRAPGGVARSSDAHDTIRCADLVV